MGGNLLSGLHLVTMHGNVAGWGWFYILRLIPDSHILNRYPTHTQRGREIEPHPRPRIEYFFNKKIEVFFASPREIL